MDKEKIKISEFFSDDQDRKATVYKVFFEDKERVSVIFQSLKWQFESIRWFNFINKRGIVNNLFECNHSERNTLRFAEQRAKDFCAGSGYTFFQLCDWIVVCKHKVAKFVSKYNRRYAILVFYQEQWRVYFYDYNIHGVFKVVLSKEKAVELAKKFTGPEFEISYEH